MLRIKTQFLERDLCFFYKKRKLQEETAQQTLTFPEFPSRGKLGDFQSLEMPWGSPHNLKFWSGSLYYMYVCDWSTRQKQFAVSQYNQDLLFVWKTSSTESLMVSSHHTQSKDSVSVQCVSQCLLIQGSQIRWHIARNRVPICTQLLFVSLVYLTKDTRSFEVLPDA